MRVKKALAAVGKGLVAGAVGTLAITVVQMLEAKFADKEESKAAAEAAEKLTGFHADDEGQKEKVNNAVHWAYGTIWGAARGLMGAAGVSEPAASGLFFGLVWGGALTMLPSLELAPPPQKGGSTELGIDALRHGLYAGAVSATYELLDRKVA